MAGFGRSVTRGIVALLAAGPWADATARGVCDEVQELLASDGAGGDHFGNAVALDGGVAVLGALFDGDFGLHSGSAYVFHFNGTSWQQVQKLLASDGAANDLFGHSVAVSGDVALVSARDDDDNGSSSGSVYVFRFDGTSWQQEQKLLASDGAAGDKFGERVALRGDVAMVGARFDDDNGSNSGSAYVFRFDGTSWQQEQKLLAADGAAGDFFGVPIAVDGDVAMVGAFHDDDNGSNSGSAYVFRFDGTSWQQEQKLLAADGAVDDFFGGSLALSGVVAVVSSNDDDNGTESGSAYVFRFDGTSWQQEQKLLASDGAAADYFGQPLAVSGEVVIAGATSDDDNGSDSGSVYVFHFDGASWQQEQKLLASDGAASDFFGSSLAVSGEVVMVGAGFHNHFATDDGAAYVFHCVGPCQWDCGDGDGVVGVVDFLALLTEWGATGTPCDVDGSGVGVTDFLDLLAHWGACP